MSLEQAKHNMIEQQIRPWDVLDPAVLDLYRQIPRDAFVADAYKSLAYADVTIPIGAGQSMWCPREEAKMLQAMSISSTDRVLQIGIGAGFVTACLANQAASVEVYEADERLLAAACSRLDALNISNISYHTAAEPVDQATYDVIFISAVVDAVPASLLPRLTDNGRLGYIQQAEVPLAQLLIRIDDMPASSEIDLSDPHADAYKIETLFTSNVKPVDPQQPAFVF